MSVIEQRRRYREILDGDECVHPASVFDPISGRIAQDLGFRVGMFAGSIASATVLGRTRLRTPDPQRIRRPDTPHHSRRRHPTHGRRRPRLRQCLERHAHRPRTRTRRCIRHDHRGHLPTPTLRTIRREPHSQDEMIGKLKGALAARQDPSMAIFGRTSGIRIVGLEETAQRVKAYSQTGVDGIFLAGLRSPEELQAIRQVTSSPAPRRNPALPRRTLRPSRQRRPHCPPRPHALPSSRPRRLRNPEAPERRRLPRRPKRQNSPARHGVPVHPPAGLRLVAQGLPRAGGLSPTAQSLQTESSRPFRYLPHANS